MAKVGDWNLATPAGSDAPSTLDNVIRDTRTDIDETLAVNMNVDTGRLNTNASSLSVANAGIIRLQTTARVLELDDGTEVRPLNYKAFGQMNYTTRTSNTELRYSINSGSAFTYDGHIVICFISNLSVGAAAADNHTLSYGTVVGTYGTTATTGIIGSTQTGQLISIFSGALAKEAVFWRVTIGGGSFTNVAATDHAAFWAFFGDST